jgi:hypothetical protein
MVWIAMLRCALRQFWSFKPSQSGSNKPKGTLLNRRDLMLGAGATSLAGCSDAESKATKAVNVNVVIDPHRVIRSIPADFIGLGYEISSVAKDGLLSPSNQDYVELVRNLSSEGVIRIGGDTSDFSVWSPDGKATTQPRSTVTNLSCLKSLGGFLDATGWKLIWGLNLGSNDAESAADQAVAVARAAGDRLLCFQIGNEPDLFVRNGHRSPGYSYTDYRREFVRFVDILEKRVGNAPLAGPDVADAPDWVSSFAQDEGRRLKLLTAHYYRAGAKDPAASISTLLNTDPRFINLTRSLLQDSRHARVPYRLVELNSFWGGGKPGVSDSFASALWGLDLMFLLAIAGGNGVNWETGLNQLGFVSSYSPIFEDDEGRFSARPLYYGILAFSRAAKGDLIHVSNDAGGVNFSSYATYSGHDDLRVTLINKDLSQDVLAQLQVPENLSSVEMSRLSAPSADAVSGVTFAEPEPISRRWFDRKSNADILQSLEITVPSIAAVMLRFSRA